LRVTAIIAAAGSGKRIGSCLPAGTAKKQFLEILGKSILSMTVSVFEECQSVDDIIVVVNKDDVEQASNVLSGYKKLLKIVPGGAERQNSVYNGLQAASRETDIVVIHDGARPLVTKEMISGAINEAKTSKAVITGMPVKDTIKTVSKENVVLETLDRDTIWIVQTPQAFEFNLIKEAYERANKIGYLATDDSKLVERLGISVKMVMGSYENIKITTKEDMKIAEAILKERES